VNWIEPAQDMIQRQAFMTTSVHSYFLTSHINLQQLKMTLNHGVTFIWSQ